MSYSSLFLITSDNANRYGQAVLTSVTHHYIRSTRFILPYLFDALAKGTDADRMKGALYLLSNKGTASYALADRQYSDRYITALLDCQHQEKVDNLMARRTSLTDDF